MKRPRIVITPRSFGRVNSDPIDRLRSAGLELVFNPHGRILTRNEMIELIADADGVILGVDPFDAEVVAKAKRLKVISKYGVGMDNIDLEAAKAKGIAIEAGVNPNKEAVADFTIALMLAVARRVTTIDRACRKLDWRKPTTVDMWEKTLGLIGLGNIGKAVALRAQGFRMRILAYDMHRDEAFAAANGIEYVPLDVLLRASDFVSLHLPLLDSTRHIIGKREFGMLKKTAVLVNTARGGLIDEEALLDALRSESIWGAGIDVFEEEPPARRELLELDNLVIGSHCAASTFGAIENMSMQAAENLLKHLPRLISEQSLEP